MYVLYVCMPSSTTALGDKQDCDFAAWLVTADWSDVRLLCKEVCPALTKQQISTCYMPSKQNTGWDHTGKYESTMHPN